MQRQKQTTSRATTVQQLAQGNVTSCDVFAALRGHLPRGFNLVGSQKISLPLAAPVQRQEQPEPCSGRLGGARVKAAGLPAELWAASRLGGRASEQRFLFLWRSPSSHYFHNSGPTLVASKIVIPLMRLGASPLTLRLGASPLTLRLDASPLTLRLGVSPLTRAWALALDAAPGRQPSLRLGASP